VSGIRIARIVLTHAHQDHVGGLDALAAELPT
jgi:glyoxylase-like metal-dependent hydrolase (beta-lactamase superfamily II)